jgi:hypothetical protein
MEFSIVLFSLVSWDGVRLGPLGTSATTGLFYQPHTIDDDERGTIEGYVWQKKAKYSEITCSSTTLKPVSQDHYFESLPHEELILLSLI